MGMRLIVSCALFAAAPLSAQDTLLSETRRMVPPLEDLWYGPVAAAAGDVDLDGRTDVVVSTVGQTALWRGSADGRFVADPQPLTPAYLPEQVVLLDIESDGDLDLFLVEFGPGPFHALHANDGAGVFADASSGIPAVNGAKSAIAGDFDGDGDADLILGGHCTSPFCLDGFNDRLWRNDGAGTYADEQIVYAGVTFSGGTERLLATDLDLDGDLDLVPNSATCLNDGSGAFTFGQQLPTAGGATEGLVLDRENDGDPDLLFPPGYLPSALFLLDNDGAGHLSALPAAFPDELDAVSVGAFDFTGDGFIDVVVGEFDGGQRLFANDGAGGLVDAGGLATDGAFFTRFALDAENDGDEDLVMISVVGPVLLCSDGTGTAVDVTRPMPWVGEASTGIVLLDLDEDGDLDVLNSHRLFLNEGAGQLGSEASAGDYTASSDIPRELLAHDLDGDGHQDLLDGALQRALVYRNVGGTLLSGFELPGSGLTSALAADDFDGDGLADVLLGYLHKPAELFRGAGGGTFEQVLPPPFTSAGTADLEVADFDGDGTPDVYLARQALDLFYVNQGGVLVPGAALPASTASRATAVASGDVDLDGDIDVAVACAPFLTLPALDLLLLNQGGTFTDATAALPVAYDDTREVLLADLDVDGLLDLTWLNFEEPSRMLRNLGGGAFVDASERIPQRGVRVDGAAVGDLDGDQDPEVVVAAYGPLELWTNLRRQIAWGAVPRIGYTVPIELSGSPLAPWWVAWSPARAKLPFPPLGTLFLDPAATFVIAFGLLSADGTATLPVPIPDAPALIGLEVYVQALIGNPVYLANLEVVGFEDF